MGRKGTGHACIHDIYIYMMVRLYVAHNITLNLIVLSGERKPGVGWKHRRIQRVDRWGV